MLDCRVNFATAVERIKLVLMWVDAVYPQLWRHCVRRWSETSRKIAVNLLFPQHYVKLTACCLSFRIWLALSTIRPRARHRLPQFTVTTAEDSVPRAPVRHSFFCKKITIGHKTMKVLTPQLLLKALVSRLKKNTIATELLHASQSNKWQLRWECVDNYDENIQRSQLITDIQYSTMTHVDL